MEYTNLEESTFFSRLLGDNTGVNLNHAAVAATSAAGAAPASQPVQEHSQVNTAAAPADTQTTATDSAAHAEQMLQYWWLQANEETRKQFYELGHQTTLMLPLVYRASHSQLALPNSHGFSGIQISIPAEPTTNA